MTTIQTEMGKVTMQSRMEKKVRSAAQQPLSPSSRISRADPPLSASISYASTKARRDEEERGDLLLELSIFKGRRFHEGKKYGKESCLVVIPWQS